MTKLLPFAALLCCTQIVFSQKGPAPVQPADFSLAPEKSDSGAAAIVLLDSSSCTLTANPQRGFYTIYHRLRRVLIVSKDALSTGDNNVGTETISYNKEYNGDKKLKALRAVTYNLENGKIVTTALQDKDIYVTTDKKKDNYVELKFAYASAKVGSIVELEYTVDHYSRDLLDWYFQGYYPVAKAVYTAKIPEIWNFVLTTQNKQYITGIQRDSAKSNFYSWQYNYHDVTFHSITWTAAHIPAMKTEPFTSTNENYIGCVKFQLSIQPVRPGYSEQVYHSWQWLDNRLLAGGDFGTEIDPDKHPWAKRIAKEKIGEIDNNLFFARKLFALVRDNFKTSERGVLLSKSSLKDIYDSKEGNSADVNLSLVLMLRSYKFKADPVVLSTRDNGLTNPEYPILEKYNYTICRLEIDGHIYYLDASDRKIGFGKLPTACYNGYARVITTDGYPVYLRADSIRESTSSFATIEYDSASSTLVLNYSQTLGYYESLDVRHQLDNQSFADYVKSIMGKKLPEGVMDSTSVSDLDSLDRPIRFFYRMKLNKVNGENVYFNPILNNGVRDNPFKSLVREYPVELPYTFDRVFVLNMDIPTGFDVDEMPKSEKIALNDNEGQFYYLIQQNPNSIQLKSVFNIKKSTFGPEDYTILRNFYAEIIKKQAEVIVFKKLNAR